MAITNKVKLAVGKIMPKFVLGGYHFAMAFLGAVRYGFPARKLKVIGVTGTNGKSTTVMMIAQILEEAGYKVAVSSSVEFRIAGKVWKNQSRMTMPGRFALQKLLHDAVAAKCQYAVIEVSSEGVKQHRHRFIGFEAAVITNVTPEHIESHGSFKKYRAAKGEFFAACKKIHIINGDDENCGFFANFKSRKKYVYGVNAVGCDSEGMEIVRAQNVKTTAAGSSFKAGEAVFGLELLGEFNVYNALAAICAARSQGIALEVCRVALANVSAIPGRMEQIVSAPFKVFVDYAVTPDSLEKAYQAMKNNIGGGKLICVLGACGGGRDKWKRPVMGGLAKKYCDRIILTNEDPYDEDPMAIIDQIAGGGKGVEKIVDRREAIGAALKGAKAGDAVLVTGKGCEDSMCVAGGKKIPWNDKIVILEELDILNDGN